jgi:MFS family permease
MVDTNDTAPVGRWRAFEPLRERTFRTIWSASLLSNFGQLVQGVGAAWAMTRLTSSTGMVAAVQTALMLPLMLVAVPAGAIADMFDRRKIALVGLGFATCCAAVLTGVSALGLATPWVLLASCSFIGAGVALYSPAWQASVVEQVQPEHLPAAIALSSISYNIARSFGPALGGMIVIAAGPTAAFAVNALFYLPLIGAFSFWRRKHVAPRLPPERMDRAIVSGARYALHSPPIRIVLLRAFSQGLATAAATALMPLVARDLLKGNAGSYGLLLGATGVGAVVGALLLGKAREHLTGEQSVRWCAIVSGAMVMVMGLSRNLAMVTLAVTVAGGANMLMVALLNVGVQLSVPRWVAARALTWFTSSLTGGIALGAWIWGHVAARWGIADALLASGGFLFLLPLIGLVFPMPQVSTDKVEVVDLGHEPEVALGITTRSGPIVIEIDYQVRPDDARQFYDTMLKLSSARSRNGAYGWSIARDISDQAIWTERYHYPTWGDYVRQRSRMTVEDRELQAAADAFHTPMAPGARVRRRLERPLGSVRWRAETPDPRGESISLYTP